MVTTLEKYGYTFCRGVLDKATTQTIIEDIEMEACEITRAGIRNPEARFYSIQQLIQSPALQSIVHQYLLKADTVRSILFDKSVDTDWGVPWHQDLTLFPYKPDTICWDSQPGHLKMAFNTYNHRLRSWNLW